MQGGRAQPESPHSEPWLLSALWYQPWLLALETGPALRRIGNKEINNKYTPPCHVEKEVRREAKQNSMREGVCLGGARTLSYIIREKSLRK